MSTPRSTNPRSSTRGSGPRGAAARAGKPDALAAGGDAIAIAPGPRVCVWLRREQQMLLRQCAAIGAWRIMGIGGPAEVGAASASGSAGGDGASGGVSAGVGGSEGETPSTAQFAEKLGARALGDDLRSALSMLGGLSGEERPDAVLLMHTGDFGIIPATRDSDADAAADCTTRGVRLLSLDPLPASLLSLGERDAGQGAAVVAGPEGLGSIGDTAASDPAIAGWSMPLGLCRLSPALGQVLTLMESFGPVRTLAVQCLATPAEGTLGARVFDAMDIVHALLGQPETIDAAYIGVHDRGLHPLPGEHLGGLHGDLTANLRFAGGRAAAVVCSDRAGRFEHLLTIIGPGGRIRVFNDGFEWTDARGRKIDESRRAGARRTSTLRKPAIDQSDTPSPGASVIVEQVQRVMDLGAAALGGTPIVRYPEVLAMAQAALLSARTGEGERPVTLLRMAGLG
ncbi:MAG: hypothetical protein ACK5XO_00820 [Phycisphaerales bacterium]